LLQIVLYAFGMRLSRNICRLAGGWLWTQSARIFRNFFVSFFRNIRLKRHIMV